MHKKPKTWVRWMRRMAGVCALLFLLSIVHTEGTNGIFGLQKAYAEHPTNCDWYNVTCWIEAYVYHIALPFLFTLAWFIVAALWVAILIIRLLWWAVYELVIGVAGLGIMLSTQIIESAVHPGSAIAQGLLYNRVLLDSIHDKLWIPVRDLVHVGFALLLIAGAIITIVKANKDVIAQYGTKFMIAIVLVNFSWFIPRVVLDLANVSAVAAFSLARCDECYVIETFDLQRPPLSCTEAQIGNTARRTCPTLFWTATETMVPQVANPARKAIGALLDPFRDLLRLKVLPRSGNNWARLNKLLLVYNMRNTDSDGEIPENPGYPSGWIGIGNIIQCIWQKCEDQQNPIQGKINTIPRFLDAISGLLVGMLLSTLRMIILVFLSAIFLVLYLFALIAIMAMVLLRIPIIWLTMGFMPVVALAFVMGRGGFGGFLWGVWDKFVGAAFIPAAIGLPIAAGSAILNAGSNIPNPFNATGLVAEILGPDGVMQIMFMIIAIIVIWMGVFAAISSLQNAGLVMGYMGTVAKRVQTIGQGAAMATGLRIANLPILPIGKMDKALGYGIVGAAKGGVAFTKAHGAAAVGTWKGAQWVGQKVFGAKIKGVPPPTPGAGPKPGTPPPGKPETGAVLKPAGPTGGAGAAPKPAGSAAALPVATPVAEETAAPPGAAEKGIGEEVREGARKGVIEGMGGKTAGEEAEGERTPAGESQPATKGTGWLASIGAQLQEQGGKVMQRGAVGHIAATGKEWWNKFQGTDSGKRMSSIAGGTRKLLGNLFSGSSLQKGLVGFAAKAGTGQLDTVFSDYARGGGDRSLGDILKGRLRPQASRDTAGKTADALHQRKEAPLLLDAIDKLGTKDETDALNDIRTLLGNIARDKSLNIDTDRGLPSTVKVLVDTVMDNPSHALHSTFRNRLGGKSGLSLEKDIIEALGRTNPPPATPPTSPAPSTPPATPPPTP